MRRIVLCDLDGTLANVDHRLHHIKDGNNDWDAFFGTSSADTPIEPVIEMVRALAAAGHAIHILSGRREDARADTEEWLARHEVPYERLVMRGLHDHTPDDDLKRGWVEADYDLGEILLAVEDRNMVVNMYRALGLVCVQVAPGGF
ncbi:MAG: hypothetical protein KF813_02670 [Trueperaceae bacterium]|nr:hypothetical protein [Trueperaceae bacterium]